MKKESTPLVSVIIPIYNRGFLLPRTLKSVLGQSYGNLEIIVVDDGSFEDIKSITDSFMDSRIRYIRHDKNKGLSEARNTGLKSYKGDYLEFLDADDEYLPEKTAKQVKIFLSRKQRVDVVFCGMWRESSGQMRYSLYPYRIYKRCFMMQQIMASKEIVGRTGFFDTEFKASEDLDFAYRLSRISSFAGTPEPLLIYHDVLGSITKNREKMLRYEESFLFKHDTTLTQKEKSRRYYSIGKRYIHCGKAVKGYKALARAYISCPVNGRALWRLLRYAPLVLFCIFKKMHPEHL